MSALDPREVLAEQLAEVLQTWWDDYVGDTGCRPPGITVEMGNGGDVLVGIDFHRLLSHYAVKDALAAALSVDGGPPAEPWTCVDEDGRTWRVTPTLGPRGITVAHENNLAGVQADLRPVPAGEAETDEPERFVRQCDDTGPTCPLHGMWRGRGLGPSASSDGPAAPTWPNGYGLDRLHPPAAPATCDGSGEVENLSPIARGEMPRPCPGCPHCTCGRCGTVGGGGRTYYFGRWSPCPDCGGTAPGEAPS